MAISKEVILESLRHNRPNVTAPLPALDCDWTTYPDPRAKFIEVLEQVGGRAIVARDWRGLNDQISKLDQVASAHQIASCVPQVAGNVALDDIDDPHDFASVDVAVLPGHFAVAENAAIWVTDQQVPPRVLFFLCQHLVLVVPSSAIVDHMHAAYERIASNAKNEPAFRTPHFGAFISGPSKTADIEQSLVIGAHGPRSLVVCFVDSAA